ncbi:MAG: hypothetical protein KDJ88_09820 [Bauldia sp.]|nr:hypothetical protein [Bauldia sp.]
MSDGTEGHGSSGNVRTLQSAIRRVRTAEAERSDVVVELRDAERARLDMLADELKGVFAEVPEDNDTFLFSISGGTPARLWIDMTSFVVLGRDRRTYRFLKDTRLGRTVIIESTDLDEVADCVTDYVAERIIERERAIEGDWVIRRARREEAERRETGERPSAPAIAESVSAKSPVDRKALGWVVAAFLFGILIGVAVLFGYAWMRVPAG